MKVLAVEYQVPEENEAIFGGISFLFLLSLSMCFLRVVHSSKDLLVAFFFLSDKHKGIFYDMLVEKILLDDYLWYMPMMYKAIC